MKALIARKRLISSTAEPRELLGFANQLVGKAFASGLFMFADSDLKYG